MGKKLQLLPACGALVVVVVVNVRTSHLLVARPDPVLISMVLSAVWSQGCVVPVTLNGSRSQCCCIVGQGLAPETCPSAFSVSVN